MIMLTNKTSFVIDTGSKDYIILNDRLSQKNKIVKKLLIVDIPREFCNQ